MPVTTDDDFGTHSSQSICMVVPPPHQTKNTATNTSQNSQTHQVFLGLDVADARDHGRHRAQPALDDLQLWGGVRVCVLGCVCMFFFLKMCEGGWVRGRDPKREKRKEGSRLGPPHLVDDGGQGKIDR